MRDKVGRGVDPVHNGGTAPSEAPEGGGGVQLPKDEERTLPGQGGAQRGFATAEPGGRLRRLAGGRRRRVKVLLSREEEARIVPRAAAEGLSVQRLLIESALPHGRPSLLARRALYSEFFAARRDLHGACTNLTQLAHLDNQRRESPDGVADCSSELGAAMDRLFDLAGLLKAHPKGSRGRVESGDR